MAELVANFLGPVIEVVAPIKDQFDYLRCFNSNIQNLRDEAGKLENAKKGLQMQVDREKDNLHIILPDVETWLINSEEMKSNKDIILNEVSNVGSGFTSWRARFSLSKRAKRTADQMKELRDQLCKFSIKSQPPPPAATLALPQKTPMEFESRKYFEEEIMKTLRCMEVNMIGICGMGGVGKTTMAMKIMNRALEERLCNEVAMVVISQQVDNLRIQLEIGRTLGLELEKESPQSRAQKLHARLSGPKRTLLLLDDVWRRPNLEDLGIPCGSGCKILVTSRNGDVLSAMDKPKICGLQILTDEEAWVLFRKKAGVCVDATDLKSVAEKVVRECRGLPIALATVGLALKDEKRLSIWEDALGQLAKANPKDLPNVIEDVYKPLKLSYDFLSDSNAKSIFLLCCVFREDDYIPIEHLTWFAMGLRIFGEIWGLEETRNRVCQLIKTLKNRFLLLDCRYVDHVTMHDVVRDVCTFIASEKGLINCNDCKWKWVSSFVEGWPRLLAKSIFPHLRLVFVDNRLEPKFQINESFIERTRELHVMLIERSSLRSIPTLPHKMQLLKNLVTLVVWNCHSLETISDVSHLVSLEILIFRECKLLVVGLPVELKALKRLRLLEVSNCTISKLAPGVISSLVALEELKLVESFKEWEADVEGKERENAGLEELEALTNLRCLKIQVLNSRLFDVQLRLSPKLVKFNVAFGLWEGVQNTPRYTCSSEIYHKKLFLEFSAMKSFSGDLSTNTFVRSTEYLHAIGLGSNAILKLEKAQNVKWLCLDKFETVDWRSVVAFPLLESLSLISMNSLEEIWDGLDPSNSFKNLKRLRLKSLPRLKQLWRSPYDHNNVVPIFTNLSCIDIRDCDALGHVFSPATKDLHLQLEHIQIVDCDVMEHVVLVQNVEGEETTELGEGSRITIFRKLSSMFIGYMPKLMSICNGTERIEFPKLDTMEIDTCESMNCLVSTASLDDHSSYHYHDLDSTHLFCEPKVSFCNLKKLTMEGISNKNAWCDQVPSCFFRGLEYLRLSSYCNIKSLFSSSIAQNLFNLQTMSIYDCGEMVKVIEDVSDDKRLFPRLEFLFLHTLPKLESFCEWRCAVELPSLKDIHITNCRELRNFNAAGSIITPALLSIKIDGQECLPKEDMNAVLQQHFEEELEERERKAKKDLNKRKRKAIQEQKVKWKKTRNI